MRQSVELQLKELNDASMSKLDTYVPSKKILNSKHAILILVLGCTLSVLLVSIVILKPKSPKSPSNVNPVAPATGAMPFSLLDPVHDLNLASFDRPEDSSPPKAMFIKRPDGVRSTVHDPLPTNAWYQNLLMLRGEPSNIHRVYSTPYLLDVVGPVPGIRANSNHILSSTSVLQLTFIEQFGITLGAAPSFAHHSPSKEHDFKYQALETTELGVTLKWVSGILTDRASKNMFSTAFITLT